MATGGSSAQAVVSVCFRENKLTLHLKRSDKVSYVVQRSAMELKENPDECILLHRGRLLNPTDTVESIVVAGPTTVLHLQKKDREKNKEERPAQAAEPEVKPHTVNQSLERLFGFCRGDCENMLTNIRPLFVCSSCRQEGTFTRHQVIPVNFHGDDISVEQLMGRCSNCNRNVSPIVTYQCKVCSTKNVPFLKQVHENKNRTPCMQCGKFKNPVVVFNCSSGHTMCCNCFSSMCKILLDKNFFKNFPLFGFSVNCPGPGADCGDTPVADPHHFYLIDNAGEYYKTFKDKSVMMYAPPGDNILCSCKYEIDMSSGKETEVVPAGGDQQQPTVGGGMWFLKRLLRIAPPPPPPKAPRKTRRQVSCQKCKKSYCVECKEFWHEGDCQPPAKEEDISLHYQVERAKADASRWH